MVGRLSKIHSEIFISLVYQSHTQQPSDRPLFTNRHSLEIDRKENIELCLEMIYKIK
jgi:hypothetical protein